jgi:hypothetical protein
MESFLVDELRASSRIWLPSSEQSKCGDELSFSPWRLDSTSSGSTSYGNPCKSASHVRDSRSGDLVLSRFATTAAVPRCSPTVRKVFVTTRLSNDTPLPGDPRHIVVNLHKSPARSLRYARASLSMFTQSDRMYATNSQIWRSSRLFHDGMAVPAEPSRIVKKRCRVVDAACQASFAKSGGAIPISRSPRPSPRIPWQIAQCSTNDTRPLWRASFEARRPLGTLRTR